MLSDLYMKGSFDSTEEAHFDITGNIIRYSVILPCHHVLVIMNTISYIVCSMCTYYIIHCMCYVYILYHTLYVLCIRTISYIVCTMYTYYIIHCMYYVYVLYHTLYTCLVQFEVHNTICTVLLHPQTSETIIYSTKCQQTKSNVHMYTNDMYN